MNLVFQIWQSLKPLPPLRGETDICTHWVFCRKLNSKQFLFELFFLYNRYFLWCSALKWIKKEVLALFMTQPLHNGKKCNSSRPKFQIYSKIIEIWYINVFLVRRTQIWSQISDLVSPSFPEALKGDIQSRYLSILVKSGIWGFSGA